MAKPPFKVLFNKRGQASAVSGSRVLPQFFSVHKNEYKAMLASDDPVLRAFAKRVEDRVAERTAELKSGNEFGPRRLG